MFLDLPRGKGCRGDRIFWISPEAKDAGGDGNDLQFWGMQINICYLNVFRSPRGKGCRGRWDVWEVWRALFLIPLLA